MAIVFTSITPNEGLTSGKTRVKIEGENFDVHPFPPPSGYIGRSLGPSVKVYFDGFEAENVIVYPKPGGGPTETVIECNIPRYVGDSDLIPASVDVKIENLLNPEIYTELNGFRYVFPDAAGNSSLVFLTYALMLELSRQTPIPKHLIVQRVHTSFDDDPADGLNLVQIAGTPTLAVIGPSLRRSYGSYKGRTGIVDTDGTPEGYREFRCVEPQDLTYNLILIDENQKRLLNLIDMIHRFPEDNGSLKVEKVFGDPSQGFYEYDLSWESEFTTAPNSNRDNLVSASASLIVRGVFVERLEGVELGLAVLTDDQGAVILTEKKG